MKIKSMYSKNIPESYYGNFGIKTPLTYLDSTHLETGDIVELYYKRELRGERIVTDQGVMSVCSYEFKLGVDDNWNIRLVKKWYEHNETIVDDIIIKEGSVNTNNLIEFQGGLLDLNRAKELGIWKEKYVEPTDDGIIARIKSENEKVGYVADWKDKESKYYIYYDSNSNEYNMSSFMYSKYLGATYTTYPIAEQITTELNEKRFMRV